MSQELHERAARLLAQRRIEPLSPEDQIFWAGPQRVVVGPALLVPRAVATWTESS